MEKQRTYPKVKFPLSTIEEAYNKFLSFVDRGWEKRMHVKIFSVTIGNEKVTYDSIEEFLSSYQKAERYNLYLTIYEPTRALNIMGSSYDVDVKIQSPSAQEIDSIMYVFERDKTKNMFGIQMPIEDAPQTIVRETITPQKIFIGHGHDEQWRKLKDHLLHQQRYEVIFYEEAPRAGLVTGDVLKKMLAESDIALLLFTGEVADASGAFHARDNVIHELGLFQGRLGFERAIMLLEDGVYEPSNVHGVNQIRFPKGKLHEKYGDIVANVRRIRQE